MVECCDGSNRDSVNAPVGEACTGATLYAWTHWAAMNSKTGPGLSVRARRVDLFGPDRSHTHLSRFQHFLIEFCQFFFLPAHVFEGQSGKHKKRSVRTMRPWCSRHSRHIAEFGSTCHCYTPDLRVNKILGPRGDDEYIPRNKAAFDRVWQCAWIHA